MTTRSITIAIFLAAAVLYACHSSSAQTSVTLAPTKDNTLYESATGSLSNGAGQHMFVGVTAINTLRRALIAFDIAGNVPAGATIDSVKLTLNFSRTIVGDFSVKLHRAVADWGEGTSNASGPEGMGAPSATNDATWIHTFFNSSSWVTAGGDFSPTVSASKIIGGSAQYGLQTWGSTPEMVADVQDWLNNPSTNFGWFLIGDETTFPTAKRFSTKEDPIVANRPALTVYYNESIPCGDFTNLLARCVSGGTVQARVTLLNSTIHAGKTIDLMVDGDTYTATIVTNGTHSRAQVSVPGYAVGNHTVSMSDPPGCLTPRVVTCPAGLSGLELSWAEDDVHWTDVAATQRVTPAQTRLVGNYPNPFNPSTVINYELREGGWVTLGVFNIMGQSVSTLVDGFQDAGQKSVLWDGRNESGEEVAAGVYVYSLLTPNTVNVQKMILMR
jgi:hypothetical protein